MRIFCFSRISLKCFSTLIGSFLTIASVFAVTILSGCGVANNGTGTGNGKTNVTLLASSSANGQLSQFSIVLDSLTLTDDTDKSVVSLIGTPLHVEFLHLNGTPEPILTVSVPQGTYTSATVTIDTAQFACVDLNSAKGGGLEVSYFAATNVTGANLPAAISVTAPISIAGGSMGLQLDLLVSQSATWKTCNPNGLTPFSITPTFRLSPLQFSSAPTNAQNGFETGLKGVIAAVTGSSFTVTAADGLSCNPPAGSTCSPAAASGPAWQVAAAPNAIFQGITDASHLAIGMPVDMDAAIQPDGSLQASRIAVFDTNPANLSVYSGPLLAVAASEPVLNSFGTEEQGKLLVGGADFFNFGEAAFQISNQLTNVSSLPFAASFTAANIVAGQNVDITTHALSVADGPTYVPATTVTLRPQTINGTVSAITKQGNFTVYTVALGPYDLFPELAVQPGQTTLLTDPGTVVIYTDSSTQALSSSPPAVGDVQRFTGIVFNDGGILRMDCASINDGVPE